ncbi:MAG TPA: hypothetical protein GXZ58_04310 [Bacilli bacterium]|nr:hypothetical protein [Bacilli bacterium]
MFSGNTGEALIITDQTEVEQIVSNLNGITPQNSKPSLFHLGYGYKLTIYNKNNKVELYLMINGDDTIRYRGFFYTAKESKINIDAIDRLFED